ncbi:M28 family metallopeptidase [Actinomadura kijaniata]|uniref:M28 family metallopeptidase n=1 Tax=Actinomadura kijaniata TaxID=46161 RepID=UPI00082FD7C4|nr:M28 family metallopeptidase [Actinomadura kijaniata]
MRKLAIGAAAVLAATLVTVPPAEAAPDLASLVTLKDVRKHLQSLQTISDYNGGSRAVETPGYEISVKYVVSQLKKAGFTPTVQPFSYTSVEEKTPTVLAQTAPDQAAYKLGTDFTLSGETGNGDVNTSVTAVDVPAPGQVGDAGCEAADFAGFPQGNIALIQRGACPFEQKFNNAKAAGASAVVFYNRPDEPGLLNPLLNGKRDIPVAFATRELGGELAKLAQAGGLKLRLKVDLAEVTKKSTNVIAETKWGRSDNVVVVGAHLDGVHEGPGINDNGTGSAAILAAAQKIHKLGKKQIRNKVRFAWWGAEEEGLRGSTAYVAGLSAEERAKIALNLNFDMLGSINGIRGIYDGDNSSGQNPTVPPVGSGAIEKTFADYYAKRKLPTIETEFSGRSDYGPFIEVGIPAGGLFSGAEVIKTPEQAKLFGGTAGQPYDPCYHQACDTIKNIDWKLLDTHADGVAFATQAFAKSTLPVNGETRRVRSLRGPAMQYKGDRAVY